MSSNFSLNEDLKERKMGWIFLAMWLAVLIIYLTWDGWVYEWRMCGYNGLNQHFDLDIFDMEYTFVDGAVVYQSTNNLHNIVYLCFFTFFMGWTGLLFDWEWARQGAMATLAFPVVAAMSTLDPITDHLYFLQIVYNFVHISGIIMGVYFFWKEDMEWKKTLPGIFIGWVIYIFSRILLTPWPYWKNDGLAYFGANQMNDMPLYFYGFEYGLVVLIFLSVNLLLIQINSKIPERKYKALFPFLIFFILCVVFIATGLITLQIVEMTSCP